MSVANLDINKKMKTDGIHIYRAHIYVLVLFYTFGSGSVLHTYIWASYICTSAVLHIWFGMYAGYRLLDNHIPLGQPYPYKSQAMKPYPNYAVMELNIDGAIC